MIRQILWVVKNCRSLFSRKNATLASTIARVEIPKK